MSVKEARQQQLLEDHLRMQLQLQAILDIFKSYSILYQSPIIEVGINSDNPVLEMTLSLRHLTLLTERKRRDRKLKNHLGNV